MSDKSITAMNKQELIEACYRYRDIAEFIMLNSGHALRAFYDSHKWEVEEVEERYERVARDLNGLIQVVREMLGVELYSNVVEDGQLIWTVRYPGGERSGFADVNEAYKFGIQEVLKQKEGK